MDKYPLFILVTPSYLELPLRVASNEVQQWMVLMVKLTNFLKVFTLSNLDQCIHKDNKYIEI